MNCFLTLLTHQQHLVELYLTNGKDSIQNFSSNNLFALSGV